MTKHQIVTIIGATEETLHKEVQFTELNGQGFVRGANALDQCVLLIDEAWHKSKLPDHPNVRAYLATMLHRFMSRTELFEQLAAFDYIKHVLGLSEPVPELLQDVADMCLQCVAFFPERSSYRHEPRSLQYVAEMGVGMYGKLARTHAGKDDWFSLAYGEMAKSFGLAVMVLRSGCSRFVLQQEIRSAVAEGGVRFPTDVEARHAAYQTVIFGKMYTSSRDRDKRLN